MTLIQTQVHSARDTKIFLSFVQKLSLGKRLLLSLLAGVLSVLALAPIFAWPILFITLSMLILLLYPVFVDKTPLARPLLQTGLIGWCFGFGYFMAGLYWMGSAFLVEADKFAWALPLVALLPAFLAFFYAAACMLCVILVATLSKDRKNYTAPATTLIFALALSFALTEWLRGHVLTGFPWNSIGYGWAANDFLMQSAAVIGIYGINFFTVLIFASPAVLFIAGPDNANLRHSIKNKIFFVMMLGLLLTALYYGYARLQTADIYQAEPTASQSSQDVRLRLVQPNIPQTKKWDPKYKDWAIARYLELSRTNYAGVKDNLEPITHLIWPEVAWPLLMARDAEGLKKIAELLPDGKHLLTGSLRLEQDQDTNRIYNSLFVFDDKAHLKSSYDKIHLVPFGEYLPFQDLLEALGLEQLTRLKGGFTAGNGPRVLRATGAPHFSPLICYEIIFPNGVIEDDARPKWLLNITNDAWFGVTAGPYQHFHQARVRAVEEGLPIVRVANTGISAIISPYGHVIQHLPLAQSGVIDGALPKPLEPTLYAKSRYYGFWLIILLGFIFLLLTFKIYDEKTS